MFLLQKFRFTITVSMQKISILLVFYKYFFNLYPQKPLKNLAFSFKAIMVISFYFLVFFEKFFPVPPFPEGTGIGD